MSDRVILKRGTGTQNDSYSGTIGELTYDTTSATIRVFDGVTSGGTRIVKSTDLSANLANYTNTGLLSSNYTNNAQLSANLANYTNTGLLQANLTNYPNTTQLSANLANYTNTGLLQANLTNYPNTTQLSANLANYQTSTGLAANVAILAANSASYLGSIAANQYSTTGKAIAMAMVFGG